MQTALQATTPGRLLIQNWSLAIVCPMANERATAAPFVKQMLSVTEGWREVVFLAILDRASTDGTLAELQRFASEEPRLRVVWAPEDRCVVDAYIRGYKEAIATGFDWVLEIDAGFSHRPEDFAGFIDKLSPEVDCVLGSRFCAGGAFKDSPLFRYVLSKGGTLLSNALLGTRLSDMTSGYQLFRRDALRHILDQGIRSRAHFFQTEMKFHCRKYRCAEAPITYQNASNSVHASTVADAFFHLAGLVRRRFLG